jgi:hypothetical protein
VEFVLVNNDSSGLRCYNSFTAAEETSVNGKSTHATQGLTRRLTSSQEYKQSRLAHNGCQLRKVTIR